MHNPPELVINTSPILALIAGVGTLSFLDRLYKRVLVPYEVCQEIEAIGEEGFGVSEFRAADFLEKRSVPLTIEPFLLNTLDVGEASVIQLALDQNIRTVCVDETVGRRIARLNRLRLTGSIGVLVRASRNGLIFSMDKAIKRMQSHGIYLSQSVIDFALKYGAS